jgi:hypothetical protein
MSVRFLRYSYENHQKIRVVLMADNGRITHMNLTVTALDDLSFTYVGAGMKQGKTLPLSALLSAGYARGDSGGS